MPVNVTILGIDPDGQVASMLVGTARMGAGDVFPYFARVSNHPFCDGQRRDGSVYSVRLPELIELPVGETRTDVGQFGLFEYIFEHEVSDGDGQIHMLTGEWAYK